MDPAEEARGNVEGNRRDPDPEKQSRRGISAIWCPLFLALKVVALLQRVKGGAQQQGSPPNLPRDDHGRGAETQSIRVLFWQGGGR